MFDGSDTKAANLQLVKQVNKKLLLNLIYDYGPVSRSELARKTKLSPTTVSTLVAELICQKMVTEIGAGKMKTSGRRPILIKIAPDGGYIFSFEFLEKGFIFNGYDLELKTVFEKTSVLPSYDTAACIMAGVISGAMRELEIKADRLYGIAVGIPALIDRDSQKILSSTVIPIGNNKDFIDLVKKQFPSVQFVLENSSSLYAYAEKAFGKNRNVKNLVFIDIGTGIGSGIIIDGSLFAGSSGFAGEIGHMCIDINGTDCKCGGKGCFEVVAAVPAIKKEILSVLMSGRDTIINDLIEGDLNRISMDYVAEAINKGDILVCDIIDGVSRKLAAGINNIINIFDPEAVVIGGEVIKLGGYFLDRIRKYLDQVRLRPGRCQADVFYTDLPKDPVNLGGAKYILDRFFHTGSILMDHAESKGEGI